MFGFGAAATRTDERGQAIIERAERFLAGPQARAFEQAERERAFADRVQMVAERDRLRAAALDRVTRHRAEREAADRDVARAQGELRAAEDRRAELAWRHRADGLEDSRRIDNLEGTILATAPAAIGAFIDEMGELLNGTFQFSRALRLRNFRDGRPFTAWTNRESVRARVDAILAAIRAAQKLRPEALDGAALEARFAALRAALPAVDMDVPAEYAEFGNALLPSAGEMW
jgi:hypothetical protein